MMGVLEDMLMAIAKNMDLVETVVNAVESGKVPADRMRQVVEDLMTEAANAEMKRELGE